MEFRFGHLVDYATHDVRGKLILVGIFDLVHVSPGVPIALPQAALVASFRASALEGTRHVVQLRLTDDDADVAPRQDVAMELAPMIGGHMLSANLVVPLAGIALPHPGDYAFRFFVGGRQIGEVPFRVLAVETPPG